MSTYSSDDDLPDLDVLFPPKPLMATSANTALRRSPRKKTATEPKSPQKREPATLKSPKKRLPLNVPTQATQPRAPAKAGRSNRANDSLRDIPRLPRNRTVTETEMTSNNRQSPESPQRSLRLAHVDSLLVPLMKMAMEEPKPQQAMTRSPRKAGKLVAARRTEAFTATLVDKKAPNESRKASRSKQKEKPHYTSRFVLKEAYCNDDEENSNEEDEDEDTDLSGFIVDDGAELSLYDTSAPGSDDEDNKRRPAKKAPQTAPRRRLQRGSPTRRRLSFGEDDDSEKENHPADMILNALRDVSLEDRKSTTTKGEAEVIDLTSSPNISPKFATNTRLSLSSSQPQNVSPRMNSAPNSNPFDNFDAILKLCPPSSKPALMVPLKEQPTQPAFETHSEDEAESAVDVLDPRFKTPPATPPRSPSKLKSPSKLFSPSKRQTALQSPHRQSMDAFWDHNVINEWNDEYSPKKAPASSPRKRGLGRFQIWSDSEEDEDEEDNPFGSSQNSLPSPCSSPRKSRSPMRSPEKEQRKRLADEKRAATALKKAFNSRKEQLALDLLQELDSKVVKGQLSKLASTTGGVKIIWSKTLRSTAGRANWKRTVTKFSGSPIKGNANPSDPGMKVQHFASIELAEKIIDCEDRLVNTLAHEFCHLTNFMISNVRDQPHGDEFQEVGCESHE